MAERTTAVEPAVDELKRRARRRLVGAVVLALAAAVLLPMLLEKEPRPLGEDVAVKIPPVDDGKFTNQLSVPPTDSKAKVPESSKAARPSPPVTSTLASRADSTPVVIADSAPAAQESKVEGVGASISPSANVPVGRTVADGSTPPGANATNPRSNVAEPSRAAEAPTGHRPVADAEQRVLSPAAGTVTTEVKPQPALEPKPEPRVQSKSQNRTSPPAMESVVAGKGAPGERFVVQLAAFSDDKGANALASKLKRIGYPAFTEPVHTSRGTLFRVRVGGYASREAAGEARSKLIGEGYTGIVASARSAS